MNEIYLLEQCPRSKQDLQKLVNKILHSKKLRVGITGVNKSSFWITELARSNILCKGNKNG